MAQEKALKFSVGFMLFEVSGVLVVLFVMRYNYTLLPPNNFRGHVGDNAVGVELLSKFKVLFAFLEVRVILSIGNSHVE